MSGKFDMGGLSFDTDTVGGDFEMPVKLEIEHAIVKMDILSDWMADIGRCYLQAQTDYFIETVTLNYKKSIKFDRFFEVYLGVLDRLDLDVSPGLRKSCESAFNIWVNSKSKVVN